MKNIKILIVEDEWIIGNDMQGNLKKLGYNVIDIVATGEEAIQKAREDKPDLVLMDVILSGKMGGIEAARQIQSSFNIPVVYVTAHSDKGTLERAKITEPFGYMVKPFSIREAHVIIEIALYKHNAERRLKESERWLSTTIASIGDAVIATDKNGIVTFMNRIARSLTDCGEEDVCGRPITEIFKIANDRTKGEERPVEKVIAGARSVGLQHHTLITRNGRHIPIGDSAAPIMNEHEKVIGVVLVFSDMTERKQTEEERERLISSLQDALARVKTLSGLIPICAACKKIRDDKGYWNQLESYISERSEAEFTHGMCPECIKQWYPHLYKDI